MASRVSPGGGRRCRGTTAQGGPCAAPAGPSGWCVWHDPDRQAERKEIARRGGRATWRKRLTQAEARDTAAGGVLEYLCQIMEELRTPGLASADVNRLRCAVYAASAAGKLLETAEIEARLSALEAAQAAEEA